MKVIELDENLAGSLLNLIRVGVYQTVNYATVENIHNGLLNAIKDAGVGVYPVEVPDDDHDEAVVNATE